MELMPLFLIVVILVVYVSTYVLIRVCIVFISQPDNSCRTQIIEDVIIIYIYLQ